MSLKRDFGEKQSSEARKGTGPPNQANPEGEKPQDSENIDNLVSTFLAQLTDISSRMNQNGPDSVAVEKPKPVDFKMPQSGLEEGAASSEPVDLNGIDDEIEKSIAELENLKSGTASPKPVSPPEKPPETNSSAQTLPASPTVPTTIDSEEQAWKQLESFRTNISSHRLTPYRMKTFGAAGLVIAAAVAIFLLFRNEITKEPVSQKAISEPAEQGSTPGAGSTLPSNPGNTPSVNSAKIESKPGNSGNVANSERNKNAPAAKTVRVSNTAESRSRPVDRRSSSENGSEDRRSTEPSRSGSPAVKPPINEEPPRAAAPQVAAISPAAEQVSRVISPPPPAPEPKQNPATPPAPAKAPAENGSAAAPAVASLREAPPPDPKPAANAAPDVDTQPKIRTAVMAEVIKTVNPQYPMMARSQKISGRVEVEAEINEKGDVVRAKAVSGPILLRNAAEEAVRKWKYKPATIGGVNISSRATVTVNFNLQ